jgi:hypothetical protein
MRRSFAAAGVGFAARNKRLRTQCSDWCAKSAAVITPIASNRLRQRRPTPHTSPTGVAASAAWVSVGVSSTKTPPSAGSFLARSAASLARVLVGATPMDTGNPVHRLTMRRAPRMWASTSQDANPSRPKKASSMEYTSMSGLNPASTAMTRADRSPYNS